MKPSYQRPVLVRHESGLMNKFSRVQAMQPMTEIEGVSVEKLLLEHGSPLFVFSERVLRDRFQELDDAFRRRYPRFRAAWSYKTNYLGAICKILHGAGAYAEVVSEFEWEKARSLGVPGDHIHFNGPYKSEQTLARVLPEGTIIHLDHFDEMLSAERVAERLNIRPKVALRISLSTDGTPQWDRFGFNLESGQALDAVIRLMSGGRLELAGLHCHLGTFIQDPNVYRQAAQKMADLANEIRSRFGVVLSFIDLGGGFASHNTLKAQYLPGDQATPAFARYAEAIVEGLGRLRYEPSEMPTLVVEHGRALVDDAGSLLSTVVANKALPDGRRGVVLDAGVNLLFTSFWYRHDVLPAQALRGIPEPTVLYGPLCMNIDVVRETLLFPPLDVGDHLVFRSVGAYNVTQWMQFITYRPAVVLIGEQGQVSVIRKRETLESVTREEVMPSWLQ